MSTQGSRSGFLPSAGATGPAAGIMATVTDILYWALVNAQETVAREFPRIRFFAAFIAAMAIMAFAGGLLRRGFSATMLLSGSTIGFLALGTLAIFSIGLPLLAAGALTLVGAVSASGIHEGALSISQATKVSPLQQVTAGVLVATAVLGSLTAGMVLT